MTLLVAGEALMERVVRNFTLNDVIKRKFIPYKNLYEICSIYPSEGANSCLAILLTLLFRKTLQSLA